MPAIGRNKLKKSERPDYTPNPDALRSVCSFLVEYTDTKHFLRS